MSRQQIVSWEHTAGKCEFVDIHAPPWLKHVLAVIEMLMVAHVCL